MIKSTLIDLNRALKTNDIDYLVTRYNESITLPSDLDILVSEDNYEKSIKNLIKVGYKAFSHDKALGGRIESYQINLVKKGRVKIDLHKDFTWRAKRYLDADFIWENINTKKIAGVDVMTPLESVDDFLVMINVIFEKTYVSKDEYKFISNIKIGSLKSKSFQSQARKYKWLSLYNNFVRWIGDSQLNDLPLFLPTSLVLVSFLYKFHLIAFAYYLFFRTRYLFKKTLPYD